MSDFRVFYNPHCSKCRNALTAIQGKGSEPTVVHYLDEPPTEATLRGIIAILSDPVEDLVRKDRNFKDLELDSDAYQDEEPVVKLLLDHPELMQRPVVVQDGRAMIVRTQERIDNILSTL